DLKPARSVGLHCPAAPQHAPRARVVSVEAWIGRLHVVQHVREVEVHRAAEALVDPDLLGDAQVQVPERQAAEPTAAPNLSIQTEDGVAQRIAKYPAALRAGCVGIAEHVLSGPSGSTCSAERT